MKNTLLPSFLLHQFILIGAACFSPPSNHARTTVNAKNDDASSLWHTVTTLHLRGEYLLSLEQRSLSMGDENDDDGGIIIEGTDRSSSVIGRILGSDPYAPGVAEAFGLTNSPGTDGFDASADAVGPGIYGGSVQRDPKSRDVLIGAQYENHNHKPGPLYDGNGYSLMGRAIHAGEDKVKHILKHYPQLIEEMSTGGARPLHICGMSARGQCCTQALIDAGADVRAVDTYNYNALHRMASNDLEVGGEALVKAGLDPNGRAEGADSTPIEIARRQRAIKFLMAMRRLGHYD